MPQIFHESPVFKDGDCISMFCQDSLTELTVSFMVSRRCIENCSSCVASKVLENGGIDLQQTQCKDNGCKTGHSSAVKNTVAVFHKTQLITYCDNSENSSSIIKNLLYIRDFEPQIPFCLPLHFFYLHFELIL